jgi:hypothetical protein
LSQPLSQVDLAKQLSDTSRPWLRLRSSRIECHPLELTLQLEWRRNDQARPQHVVDAFEPLGGM